VTVRASFLAPALLAATLASTAAAQTKTPELDCESLPNPVYVTGSSALRSFVGIVGTLLTNDASPSTVVYQAQGSCVGVRSIYDPDPTKRVMKDVAATETKAANYAIFFRSDGTPQECFLKPEGTPVTIGISDVYAKSCGYTAAPPGKEVADYFGPVQPMTFVVPASSRQEAISAEAAYLAFGVGAGGPWNDPHYFFIRNASSGTQQMLAAAINVPGNAWWGVDRGGSGGVRDQLKIVVDPAQAEKTIGILSTDVADAERANLRILAFQAREQTCAFYPDSSVNAQDKQNVRDGHYALWGPTHLLANIENGSPSQQALPFLTRFVAPKIPTELLDAELAGSLVPQCAMRVSRNEEIGPLQSYQPPYSCGCYFDAKTRKATDCKPCATNNDCPTDAPSCNFGYCEVR